MAPKKESPAAAPGSNYSPRMTRSMASGKRSEHPAATLKARSKKAKLAAEKGKAEETADGKGKNKKPAVAKGEEAKGSDDAKGMKGKVLNTDPADGSSKTIIIEACKQCQSFKQRAMQVKDGLESALTCITVVVNPEKPRRGCFEIREENGETFVSLLGMARPFTKMKALDMDQVVKDIIKSIS